MAKKHADTVDLGAELKKRVKTMETVLGMLQTSLNGCVNERAQLKQYYQGRIDQVEAEVAYLKGLLDG